MDLGSVKKKNNLDGKKQNKTEGMLGFKKKGSSKVKWKRVEFNTFCVIFIVTENVGSAEGTKTETKT